MESDKGECIGTTKDFSNVAIPLAGAKRLCRTVMTKPVP